MLYKCFYILIKLCYTLKKSFRITMKKIISLLTLLLITIFTLTACGATSLSFSGSFWNKNQTNASEPVYEECVYKISVVDKTPSNSTQMQNQNVKLVVNAGEYKTTLEFKNNASTYGEHYVYTTTLTLNGEYQIKGKEPKPFSDVVTTTTVFKNILSSFAPIYSQKTASCSTYYNNSTNDVVSIAYDYKLSYGDKDATLTYKTASYQQLDTAEEKSTTFKNYKGDGAFVDNNLLLLLPRAYDYKNAISDSFNLIDSVSISLKKLRYASSTNSEGNLDIKTLPGGYSIDGGEQIALPESIKIYAYVDETFSGQSLESYYATEHSTHRHRMTKSYALLNDQIGYLEYSLSSVKTTKN